MSGAEFRSALRVLVVVTLSLAIVFGLVGGIAVGCSSNLARSARLDARRVRDNTRVEFYKFCQRKMKAGLPPPAGCPR